MFSSPTLDNNTIRKITSAGVVTTLAGTAGSSGSADGTGAAARFNRPYGVAVDGAGNVFVADIWQQHHPEDHVCWRGDHACWDSRFVRKRGRYGSRRTFHLPLWRGGGRGGQRLRRRHGNNTIRKITPAGVVTTLAGTAGSSGSADGTGAAARFNGPEGVAVDGAGNVFVADTSTTPSGRSRLLAW